MSTATRHTRRITPSLPPSYLRLIREFPLRPIRSTAEYDRAAAILDKLAVRDEKTLDRGESDYLEMLELAIEAYDDAHSTIGDLPSTPLQRLKFLLGENKINTEGLGKILGSQPLASMILSGKRGLSKATIAKLSQRFKVEPGAFL